MQTQQHNTRVPATDTAAADNEAWLKAAAARKYRIYDGKVWGGGGGLLFSFDPLPGFSLLPEAVRPLVFQSVAQYANNRVGQTAEGNVQTAVSAALTAGTIPSANTNDAFERHFIATVTERVNKAMPVPANANAEAKKTHAAEVEVALANTLAKYRNELDSAGKPVPDTDGPKFIEYRDSGIAAALDKPVTEKKRQPKAAPDTSKAISL